MLGVHRDHFSQRIDRDLSQPIEDIVKNACIVEWFARPIIARRRGPRKPLAPAMQAALRDSLRELAVEEAKLRRHHVVSSANDDFFLIVKLKAPIDLVPLPACSHFWEQTLRLLKVRARFDGFCWNQTEPGRRRSRSVGLPHCVVELIVTFLPPLCMPKCHCWSSSTLDLRFLA